MSNTANYNSQAIWGGVANVTTVGSNGGPSAYGTYDQSGNTFDWNDLDGTPGSSRGIRGGLWGNNASSVSSAGRFSDAPSSEGNYGVGFRLASSSSTPNPLNLSNFVVVGDANNAADTNGYGSVSSNYLIGKYSVTNCEYALFLNSVDPEGTNPQDIYNSDMNSNVAGGISLISTNANGSKYVIKENMGNKPVNYVSWFDAARYCNWLHNGRLTHNTTDSTATAPQNTGAYNVGTATTGNAVAKESNAAYHIPTENEWYKAAYYKGGNTNAGYWLYATQSNINPTPVTASSIGDGSARVSDYSCSLLISTSITANKHCPLRFRRGTALQWINSYPQPDGEVLKLGEPGYEKDTGKLKIGDGVSGWNNLPYLQGENSEDVILTQEDVDDAVANLLVPGSGIVLSYDDDENSLTISTSGLQPAGNYATLVNGLVPESQLPSYVDDVLEFADLASFPNPGEAGKIYVTLDTNKTYRWSGSTYIEISSGPSSTDDVPEGSINLYYTDSRVKDSVTNFLTAGSNIELTTINDGSVSEVTIINKGAGYPSPPVVTFSAAPAGGQTATGTANIFDGQVQSITVTNPGSGYTVAPTITISPQPGPGVPATATCSLVFTLSNLNVAASGVSLVGHTHTSSDITDFSDSVSVLLPTIANSGDNRLLTSDGTSTGIDAEPALTFDGYRLRIDCDCPSGNAGLSVVGDQRSTSIISTVYSNPRSIETEDGIFNLRDTTRIVFLNTRGTEASPSGLEVGDVIFNIRGDAYNPYGTLNSIGNIENRSTRILGMVSDSGTSYLGSSLEFQTTSGSGSGIWDQSMVFDHTGSLKINSVPVSLEGHTHIASEITDFSGSVSGLIPIQGLVGVSGISVSPSGTTRQISSNFIPGNGIAFNYNNDESLTISTITNNGIIPITNNTTTSLSIPGGYVIGSLSIYQNGVKLLDGIDYIANDSSDINFINTPTSGSYIEYATPTFNSSIQNLIDSSILSVYDTSIYDLGSVSGSVNINYGIDRLIQTLTLNGTTLTLNKGTGWPTTNISRDVVLQISCVASTTVIWNIVGSNWYNKPTSILPGGEYLVLLRSIGDSTIQGHYIGNKQGSL